MSELPAYPIAPPIEPMLAKLTEGMPEGAQWVFEPKWDGFRALVFRDGPHLYVQSRDLKPLDRYFPEVREALFASIPERCVLDGEIVIARNGTLDFQALQLRLHPAASRVKKLSAELPASFVAFDLLAEGGDDLRERAFAERRARLEHVLAGARPPVHVTPATRDRARALDWFHRFEGAGLDGVIAKDEASRYEPGKRVMQKIKHSRTADCVVAGFRWHKDGKDQRVGSLLLALYDDRGELHHLGVTSSFTMKRRAELLEELAPLREGALEAHPWRSWIDGGAGRHAAGERSSPWSSEGERSEATTVRAGGPSSSARSRSATVGELPTPPVPSARGAGNRSRWSAGKDLSWEPLRLERVCEVKYDHLEGDRFRHTTQFVRWRPDKAPKDCRYDQLEVTPAAEIRAIFGR
ncbi:MAG: ATP-dependent DNA ligase [Sandaracinus sp.]